MQLADDPALDASFFTGSSPHEQPRRLSGRSLVTELGVAAAGVAATAGLAVAAPHGGGTGGPAVWAALTVAYALASCVMFNVGNAWGIATQIVFVPMLAVLPPPVVPLAVIAATFVATLADVVRGKWPADRLIVPFASVWPAVGAAAVIAAFGAPAPRLATVPVYLLAFACQALIDLASSSIGELVGRGIAWRDHLRGYTSVLVTDCLLTPVGMGLAIGAAREPWAALLGVPFLGLLALLARDREARIALAERRLDALTRQRRRHQRAVLALGDVMATGLDAARLLGLLLRATAEALDAGAARVGAPRAEPLAHLGEPAAALSLAAEAAAGADGVARAESDGWAALACRFGTGGDRAVIAVARTERRFSPDDEFLLGQLATQAAMSLENARLHDHLAHQAVTDGLTGLANHRRFQELLGDERARAARDGEPLALLLLDVDDFKAVNDRLGHQAGDRVLAGVAAALRGACRGHEQPARYGGEEFAVIVPGADDDDAHAVGERLRAAVAAAGDATVSVGVASAPAFETDPQSLAAAADRALYEAKRAGKNRVAVARAGADLMVEAAGVEATGD